MCLLFIIYIFFETSEIVVGQVVDNGGKSCETNEFIWKEVVTITEGEREISCMNMITYGIFTYNLTQVLTGGVLLAS